MSQLLAPVINLSTSTLLQGTNARGRWQYLGNSAARLVSKRAELYEQVMQGDEEAALKVAVINVQIAALERYRPQLEMESKEEAIRVREEVRELELRTKAVNYDEQQRLIKEVQAKMTALEGALDELGNVLTRRTLQVRAQRALRDGQADAALSAALREVES
jgi:hypothetical protein